MYGSPRLGPSEEGCMFEDSPPICGVQPTRPWPFEEQTREPASMGLTPTVRRTISHRTTYRWKCRRWFLCRPRQWSVRRPPISQHDASYGNARCDFHARHGRDLHIPFAHRATAGRHQKLPIKDRVETTRKCWGHRHRNQTEVSGKMVGPKWLPIMLLRAFRFNLVFGLVSVMNKSQEDLDDGGIFYSAQSFRTLQLVYFQLKQRCQCLPRGPKRTRSSFPA